MWIKRLVLIASFVLLAAGSETRPAAAQLGGAGAISGDCPMAFELPVRVTCGTVTVPEDHRRPDGPEMQIAYARLASTADNPAPDPVIFIDGGPGHPTLRDIEMYTRAMAPLIARRDVVLFDQRGVGFSQPAVECPDLTASNLDFLRGQSPDLTKAVGACHQRLGAEGIALAGYTTTQIAADIPYIAGALGYETWNVYGISYGSLVALVLMSQQPEGLRSVVLDSLLIPDGDVIGDRSGLGEAGFAAFFRSCREDWLCRSAYPDLEVVYNEAFDQLEAEPAARTIADPVSGQPVTLKVDGEGFASTAAELLNTDKGRAALPGFIYAGRDGFMSDLLERQEQQYRLLLAATTKPGGAGNGMGLNVICADYAPRAQIDQLPEVERFPVVGGSTRTMLAACLAWPVEDVDALPDEPTSSSVPTLILSGAYDSSTPRSYAEHAAQTLPASQIVRFPRSGHGVMFSGQCPIDIAGAFYNEPQAKVDTTCTNQRATPLIITAAATRPLARWFMLPLFALVGIAIMVSTGAGMSRLLAERQTTFRNAARRSLWLGIVLSGVIFGVSLMVRMERPLDAAISVIPAVIAVQIALATAPDEEPYLEVLLASPRPFAWTMVERWLLIAGGQIPAAALALAVCALLMQDNDIAYALTQMIPAALLLSGLGALVSVRSKSASMGAIVALAGAGLFVARNHILLISGFETSLPRPLDLLQSVFWMVHPYLKPEGFTAADYLINRVIVMGLGLALFGCAQALLNDTEYLLVGKRSGWLRQRRGT